MRTIYPIIAILFMAVLAPILSYGQADIHFSQFYETSILRNPALTGVFADDYKVGVAYRNQWSSIANPYQTAVMTAETKIAVGRQAADFVSFGLLAYYDKAGSIDHTILGLYPALNFNKSLEDAHNSFLSVGFTGGYLQYSFDPTKATFNNQYVNGTYSSSNPTGEQFSNQKVGLWDLGAGINLNSSMGEYNNVTYIIGISGYHFTQPKTSFYKDSKIYLDTRFNLNAAASGQINEQYSFQVQGNYALQGSFYEIIGGGMIGWTRIGLSGDPAFTLYAGLFYRYQDALIPTLKVKYQDMYFGFSYDVNVSTLSVASSYKGGFEISVYKTGVLKDRNANKSKVLCPNFF